MFENNYRDDLLEMLEKRFRGDTSLDTGKMMGHPGFKTVHNNKFFVMVWEDGLLLKLPPDVYEKALERDEIIPFQPMAGRKPMGTWVVWTLPEPDEYEGEWSLIETARTFTASEPPNPKRKPRKKA